MGAKKKTKQNKTKKTLAQRVAQMTFGKLFTKRKSHGQKFLHGKFKQQQQQQQQKPEKLENSDKNCGWISEAY